MKHGYYLTLSVSLAFLAMISVSCGRRAKNAESQVEAEAVEEVCETPAVPGPGDVVTDEYLADHSYKDFFTVQPVPDDIFELMLGKTYKEYCTVPREDLRYILCLHKDLEGRSIVGEMVASETVAETLKDIFLELYEASYPIEKMRLPDYWDADDEKMMRDNNTSCFNYRAVPGAKKLSQHSLGIAVDINPLYNPYVRTRKDGSRIISPEGGEKYADRSADFDYKIVEGDLCHRLFVKNGFRWGGAWRSVKDYQHFDFAGAAAK